MRRAMLLLAVVGCARAGATGTLSVHIVSAVQDQKGPPDPSEKLVTLGTPVMLHAVVEQGGKLIADVPRVVVAAKGHPQPARSLEAADGAWHVEWQKIEAVDHSLSNTDPTFHWEPIHYVYTPIPACADKLSCAADLHATRLEDRGGLGTMAFRVVVTTPTASGATPGYEKLYRGGLVGDIARVTVRRDDTYLGYLTEMFNTPYIWGSAGEPSTVHQTERRIGSDCADFVTYGVRRLGYPIPYTFTGGLPKYTRQLFDSTGPDARGIYLDAHGQPIPFGPKGVHPGDLLLFSGHVGAVEEDRDPVGVLSVSDVMIHTCWHEPTEQPIGETDYAKQPVKVVRWKVFEK